MEKLGSDLQLNAVNAGWFKKAYPSLKSLAAWFNDLLERVKQLNVWTDALTLLRSLWVSGLFNPMSFMTAVKQVTSRKDNLPLDFMVNRCVFSNWYEVAD